MDSSKPIDVELPEMNEYSPARQSKIIPTFIDSVLYKAAAKGEIEPFNACTEPLDHLLTPTKNTILHINITQRNPSVPFLDQILTKCPSLLLQTNIRGETPLHMAARHGCHTIVKVLIDSAKDQHQLDIETGVGAARAMLRMTNIREETALHEAARLNHKNVVQVLIEEDPDYTYSANKAGETPLYLAAERSWEIVDQMLNTCTSPAYHGPNGTTVLHQAAIRNHSEMTGKILEITNQRLTKEVDQHGWTPLHHASYLGNFSIVKQLLECDKSVAYIGDKDGKIPLHLAVAVDNSCKEVVYYILEHCPDCHELADANGRNVVHFAAQRALSETLQQMFVLKGSDDDDDDQFPVSMSNLVNEKDLDGNTPLHLASTHYYCLTDYHLVRHPLVDKMAVNNNNSTLWDFIYASCKEKDPFEERGSILDQLNKIGYKAGTRNFTELKLPKVEYSINPDVERVKNSHIIVAALIVTVTFAAGFTMPGGYNGEEGSAILSKNNAFKTFIITDAIALLLSTCALFFHFTWGVSGFTKKKMEILIAIAALFIVIALIFMLIAFTAGVYAVLPHSSYLGAAICVIISFFVIISFYPFKLLFNYDSFPVFEF